MIKKIEINTDALRSACDAIDKIGKDFHDQMQIIHQSISESLEK